MSELKKSAANKKIFFGCRCVASLLFKKKSSLSVLFVAAICIHSFHTQRQPTTLHSLFTVAIANQRNTRTARKLNLGTHTAAGH